MVDTRRSAAAKSKTKPVGSRPPISSPCTTHDVFRQSAPAPPRQKTLLDLFPGKSRIPTAPAPAERDAPAPPDPPPTSATSSSPEDTEEMTVAPVVEKLRQTSLEPRPLHPFFTKLAPPSLPAAPPPAEPLPKQNTIIDIEDDETPSGPSSARANTHNEESGSREDPIQIIESPVKPLRPAKPIISSSKPLAPLFTARRPKAAPVPSPTSSPEVVLLKLPDEAVKPKLAPIFVSRSSSKATPSSNSRLSKTKEVDAPFPDKESQHVRGPQHVFSASDIPFGRRAKCESSSISSVVYEAGSLKQFLTEKDITPSISTSIPNKDTYLDTIPDEHREHPAISRFTTTSQPEGSSTHRLWVDKWRPTRAAEVLGNEANAIYLRDWIHALELQLETNEEPDENVKGKGKAKAESSRGTKRPRTIVRTVEKKRRKKKRRVDSEDEDSWIVSDTNDDDLSSSPPYEASSPVSRASPLPDLGCLTEAKLRHDPLAQYTFTLLTNTILLAGPIGSGKTAAVYACAEELGWDVLEVYPGIGRRNGAGIESLIGDAGKNHHVRKGRTGTFDGFDGGLLMPEGVEADSGTGDGPPRVRQSLILLEEVDILFKDDTNFWPAVTNFIKECRRPVICTCNDVSLVPTQDLPLQTILTFQPCGPQLVASYLQTLCFHEDHVVLNRDRLVRLYGDSASKIEAIDLPDIPNPASWGEFPAPDLRRTISSLQFLCTSSGNGASSGWEADDDDIWEDDSYKMSADRGECSTVMRRDCDAETFSYVDTYLRRRPWDTREGCERSNDDEVGHRVLFCERGGVGVETRTMEIASAAVWDARGWIRARELFRARVDHQFEIGNLVVEGIVPLSVGRREVHMEYASRVREIVAREDEVERRFIIGSRRMTRNSGGVYKRSVVVSESTRGALGRTMLS